MLKSKMIRDPRGTDSWSRRAAGNLMGLTVGITFHTPKYSECKPDTWFASQFDEMLYPKPLDEETLERRFLWWWWHTHRCNKKRHLAYRGYLYWTGPKRRYTFRYMGATHSREKWWKPFSIHKHGQYVRWSDNGPQNTSRALNTSDITIPEEHVRKFRTAMESSRQQMREYIRVRSTDGRGAS